MKYAHRERISTKITLQNTIYRSIFNRHMFLNDPDVFLLRDDNIELTNEQKYAILTIDALFGSVLMTSDNIGAYDDKKKKLLEDALYKYNNAKNQSFERVKNLINIKYELDEMEFKLTYDTERGVFINGQD